MVLTLLLGFGIELIGYILAGVMTGVIFASENDKSAFLSGNGLIDLSQAGQNPIGLVGLGIGLFVLIGIPLIMFILNAIGLAGLSAGPVSRVGNKIKMVVCVVLFLAALIELIVLLVNGMAAKMPGGPALIVLWFIGFILIGAGGFLNSLFGQAR